MSDNPTTICINGQWRCAHHPKHIDVHAPSTGQKITEIARGDPHDIDLAVMAARRAFEGIWSNTPALERGRLLTRLGARIIECAEELAELEALDTGKPMKLARNDIAATARYFEFYGGAADKVHGDTIPFLNGYQVLVNREPRGVVGHIIPWNYPAQMFGRTIAACLAAGNTTVFKPAEQACLSVIRMTELAHEVGIPPGVVNLVTGYGHEAGASLAAHPDLDYLSFTGSPEVGTEVQKAAATHHTPCVLELGGKSPQVVFEDADIDKAIPVIVAAIIQNTGQTCSAGSRVLVQRSIYEPFVAALAKRIASLQVGSHDADLDCGPLISERQQLRVNGFLERARADGVPILAQGQLHDSAAAGGFYVTPMLLGPVDPRHELAQQEVFGPVLVVIAFDDEDQAIKIANDTPFGLIAGVWTENGSRQIRVAKKIRVGQVYINGYGAGGGIELPFGGFKRSGYGRAKGFEALKEYTVTKTIVLNHG
jgi:aldehyde dehydrogenase (NAD+)